MTEPSEHFERLQEVFHELEALNEAARKRRLQEVEITDPDLAFDLIALFADSALQLEGEVERLSQHTAPPRPNRTFGPYVATRLLGEGGMGEVFEAEQAEPIERRVAVKVIRRGLESASARGRFLAERQALAALEHPNIARVYEAGSSDENVLWFSMELIEGSDILNYCDQRMLNIRERIALFVPICLAVHHAHRRGLLHRDLKPSNLLVVDDPDLGPVPKIIDFGIAKSLSQESNPVAQPSMTQTGSVLGTPDYMSPEQAAGRGLDLDTRSDVYSLGVVLFELITGDLPIPRSELHKLSFQELRERVHSDQTPLASRRMRSGSQEADRLAQLRGTDSPGLVRQLRGDVDWVLGRALESAREDRYDSADAFARDLMRLLSGEPVEAGPPTFRRRLRTVFHRHRTAAIVLASTGTALLLGFIVSTALFFEARRNADIADRARATSERTAEFLETLFRSADPRQHAGQEPSVRDLVEEGVKNVDQELAGEPEVQARMLLTLGDVSASLGDYELATTLLERVVAEQDSHQVPQRLVVDATDRLAGVFRDQAEPERAEALYREALRRGEEIGVEEAVIGAILNDLGIVLRRQNRFDEAEPVLGRALEIARRLSDDPATDVEVGSALNNLATVASSSGDYEKARALLQEALPIFNAALPKGHPSLATLNGNLSIFERNLGMLRSAREHSERAVLIDRAALPSDHPSIADDLHNLGSVRLLSGDYEAAAEAFAEALALRRAKFGDGAFHLADPLQGLAHTRLSSGDLESATNLYRQADEILRESSHPGAPYRHRGVLRGLATALRLLNQPLEAERITKESFDLAEKVLTDSGSSDRERERATTDRDLALLQLGQIALQRGNRAAADRYYEKATQKCEGPCVLDSPRTTVYRAAFLARAGQDAAAARALEHSLTPAYLCAWGFENPDLSSLADGEVLSSLRQQFDQSISR